MIVHVHEPALKRLTPTPYKGNDEKSVELREMEGAGTRLQVLY